MDFNTYLRTVYLADESKSGHGISIFSHISVT